MDRAMCTKEIEKSLIEKMRERRDQKRERERKGL